MAISQYLAYVICGFALLFVIGSTMAVSAGFGIVMLVLLLCTLALFGLCPGLSFFAPRLSAGLAILFGTPFFIVAILDLINRPSYRDVWFYAIPSAMIIGISIIALSKRRTALWKKAVSLPTKVAIAIASAAPASFVVYTLVRFFSRVTFK